jgi:hydrogenase nickel incorporation protein HypA/HybF
MHEEALLADLRRKLIEVTRREGGSPVRRVRLAVGALCHVTPDALRRRWPEVVDGTPAQGATLEVTVSEDPADPGAQSVRLVDLTVEERPDAPPRNLMSPSALSPTDGAKR